MACLYTGTNTKGQLERMFCFDGGLKEWPVVASIFKGCKIPLIYHCEYLFQKEEFLF